MIGLIWIHDRIKVMQLSLRQQDIINIVMAQPHVSISQIKERLREEQHANHESGYGYFSG